MFGKYPKYTLFRLWMNETCKNRDKFWIKNSITSAKRMVGGVGVGACVRGQMLMFADKV